MATTDKVGLGAGAEPIGGPVVRVVSKRDEIPCDSRSARVTRLTAIGVQGTATGCVGLGNSGSAICKCQIADCRSPRSVPLHLEDPVGIVHTTLCESHCRVKHRTRQ